MQIENNVALVSGGASGLGEAAVRRVVAAGGKALIADLNADKGKALADELGDAAVYVTCDVSDQGSVSAAVDAAADLGDLRVAVSCAGIGWAGRTLNRDGSPHDMVPFEKVIEVNVFGTFNVLRIAAAKIAQLDPVNDDGERGVVVNTASVAAFDGQTGQIAYAASKGGVVSLTLPAARDLSPVGIRVCTIAPGVIDTPLMALAGDATREGLGAVIPFPKRYGMPDEYAHLVEAIVTNPYLNGETIRLDGGIRMPPK